MAVRIIRLGSPRAAEEGLRLGTVRRPPRGVPKRKFASEDWYDVWFPNLAPSVPVMKLAQAAKTPAQWATFKVITAARWLNQRQRTDDPVARQTVPPDKFFRGLLLRGRSPLPPLSPPGIAAGKRR